MFGVYSQIREVITFSGKFKTIVELLRAILFPGISARLLQNLPCLLIQPVEI